MWSKGYGMKKKTILVTGASSGLGAEFVRQLDKEDGLDEFWITARREERLEALAQEVYHPVRIFPGDIRRPSFQEELESALARFRPQLVFLVNSAGLGYAGPYMDQTPSQDREAIEVNIMALTRLCRMAISYMGKGSHIINISSVAAFLPQPNFALYAASKSYVLSFSRALNRELQDRGISVTAVCPNPVPTEFLNKSGAAQSGSPLKKLGYEDQEKVVSKALKQASKNKDISLSHPVAHLINFFSHILPPSFILWLESVLGFY